MLFRSEQFLANFDGLNIPVITTRSDAPSLEDLHGLLEGKVTVVVGHSGVGKSTLVNALVPSADRATGVVNFAQGAIGAIAALIYSQEFALKHRPLLLGLIVSIAVSVVLSFFYGFVMAPPRTPRRRGQGHRVPRVRPVHPRLLRMAVDRPGHGAQVAH